MADKVQVKSEECETSMFHHGLIKLMVLHQLQKINREWSSFLFLGGFGVEAQTTVSNPKAKETPPEESSKPVVARSKRFMKLKPRKQVKEKMGKTSVVIVETPKPAK